MLRPKLKIESTSDCPTMFTVVIKSKKSIKFRLPSAPHLLLSTQNYLRTHIYHLVPLTKSQIRLNETKTKVDLDLQLTSPITCTSRNYSPSVLVLKKWPKKWLELALGVAPLCDVCRFDENILHFAV